MQVWAGGCTGGAHCAHAVPLLNTLPTGHIYAAQVCVQRAFVLFVLDLDGVAVAALPASKGHHAVTNGAHRGASGGCIVNA